jgi:hypothetical protein
MFEDLFYPNNQKRALRAVQLGTDCVELDAQTRKDVAEIETLLGEANDAIISAYKGKVQEPIGFEPQTVVLGSGTTLVCGIADILVLAPLLMYSAELAAAIKDTAAAWRLVGTATSAIIGSSASSPGDFSHD